MIPRRYIEEWGGTALHKLYLQPQVRYSEDIDLVQINSEPINPIVKASFQRLLRCILYSRFDSKYSERYWIGNKTRINKARVC